MFIYLFICLFICLFIYLSIYLFIYLITYLFLSNYEKISFYDIFIFTNFALAMGMVLPERPFES